MSHSNCFWQWAYWFWYPIYTASSSEANLLKKAAFPIMLNVHIIASITGKILQVYSNGNSSCAFSTLSFPTKLN